MGRLAPLKQEIQSKNQSSNRGHWHALQPHKLTKERKESRRKSHRQKRRQKATQFFLKNITLIPNCVYFYFLKRQVDRKVLHLMVYSSNACHSQAWARLGPEARKRQGPKFSSHHLLEVPGCACADNRGRTHTQGLWHEMQASQGRVVLETMATTCSPPT